MRLSFSIYPLEITIIRHWIPTHNSSSKTASRATNRPKFRLSRPQHSSSLSCNRLKDRWVILLEVSLFDTAGCCMLWPLLTFSQWVSIFLHLEEDDTGNVSLQEIQHKEEKSTENLHCQETCLHDMRFVGLIQAICIQYIKPFNLIILYSNNYPKKKSQNC